MAKVTEEQIQKLSDKLNEIIDRGYGLLAPIKDGLDAILKDPCAPGQQQNLDDLDAKRSAIAKEFNPGYQGAWQELINTYDQASSSVKKATASLIRAADQNTDGLTNFAKRIKGPEGIGEARLQIQNCNNLKKTTDELTAPSINLENNGEEAGSADDDQGEKSDPKKNQNPAGADASGGPTNSNGQSQSTQSGQNPGNTTGTTGNPGPGKRLNNPLTKYASYNYQITLYMITANAYSAWVGNDRKDINVFKKAIASSSGQSGESSGGAYIVAQSGGINDSLSQRAPGFDLDFYIDDLKIETLSSTNAAQGEAFAQSITFKIVEPYGFSFLAKLKNASDQLNSDMKLTGTTPDYLKQFYVLGIRFLGYDINGKLITGTENFEGGVIDPNADESSIGTFERYFDIVLSEVKFKLDGRVTTYNCTARSLSSTAFDIKHGLVPNQTEIKAQTVGEALNGLVAKLNQEEKAGVDKKLYSDTNNYSLEFIDPQAKENIAKASCVLPSDMDKYKWSYNVSKTEQSTDAKGTAPPDNTKRIFQIPANVSIVQAMRRIILQSSYAENSLKVIMDSDAKAPSEKKPKNEDTVQEEPGTFKWYNLSSKITKPRWDEKRRDWVFDIKYQIGTYLAPVIESAYTSPRYKYPGPSKRYRYFFTGLNTEVISFDYSLDANYYITLTTAPGSNSVSGQVPISRARDTTNQPQTGKIGQGAETQNTIASNLMDPKGLNEARITIMGDPDFLIRDTTSNTEELYRRFYEDDGFTLNANGGQIFLEIIFNQGVDYNNKTGTFDINGSIIFWEYPEEIKKVLPSQNTAIVVLRQMDSMFSNGKFTQTFRCMAPTFSDRAPPESDRNDNANATPSQQTDSQNVQGLKPEPEKAPVNQAVPSSGGPTSPGSTSVVTPPANEQVSEPTPTGDAVASDDGYGYTASTQYQDYAGMYGDPGPEPTTSKDPRIDFDGTNWYDENGNIIPPPGG